MELRNVAGRVCHDILNDTLAIPFLLPDGQDVSMSSAVAKMGGYSTVIQQRASRLSKKLRPLVDVISGATALSVNEIELMTPPFGEAKNYEWQRLFSPVLWIDYFGHTADMHGNPGHTSILAFDPESVGWRARVSDTGYENKRLLYAIKFAHVKNRNLKKVTGHRYQSTIESPLIVFGFPDGDDEGKLVYGVSDFNDVGLANNRLWANDYNDISELVNRMYIELAFVLYAVNVIKNVRLEKVPPAHRVPKHERKYPKLDYHVLKLEKGRGTSSPKLDEQLRASPRQHLRRGHLRKIPQGRVTWVRPCIVGDAERGSIVKDYIL